MYVCMYKYVGNHYCLFDLKYIHTYIHLAFSRGFFSLIEVPFQVATRSSCVNTWRTPCCRPAHTCSVRSDLKCSFWSIPSPLWYVCMYVVCMHVQYVCMYVCMYACTVCMYVCTYVCIMYVSMYGMYMNCWTPY